MLGTKGYTWKSQLFGRLRGRRITSLRPEQHNETASNTETKKPNFLIFKNNIKNFKKHIIKYKEKHRLIFHRLISWHSVSKHNLKGHLL